MEIMRRRRVTRCYHLCPEPHVKRPKPHANKYEQNRREKNAAPKGRIKSEWIAELFLQMLMIIISSSTAAGLIVALCWLEPASPVLPGSKPAPCSVQLIQPQYPRH